MHCFFNSGASHRPFYWKTHPFEFFDWTHTWYLTFGLDEFSSERSVWPPEFSNWRLLMIFWWMSFPVKRSQKLPRNLPIRVNRKLLAGTFFGSKWWNSEWFHCVDFDFEYRIYTIWWFCPKAKLLRNRLHGFWRLAWLLHRRIQG